MANIEHDERWTIWSLPSTVGQRVACVDGRVPDARERIEVVPASASEGAVEALESIRDHLAPFVNDGEPAAEDAVDIYEIAVHALDRLGGR